MLVKASVNPIQSIASLPAIAVTYGKISQEYEMAGGSRRRISRRAASVPALLSAPPTFSTNGAANGADATSTSTAAS